MARKISSSRRNRSAGTVVRFQNPAYAGPLPWSPGQPPIYGPVSRRNPMGKGTVSKVTDHFQNNMPKRSKMLNLSSLTGPFSASANGSFGAAVSYGKQSKMLAPNVTGRGANLIRVKHRELIEPAVLGSTTFGLQGSYSINPGLPESFPWLSTTAKGWQEYEVHKLSFVYLTRTSTATSGSIMISPDLDPTNPPPDNEVSTSNNPNTVEGPVWKDLRCDIDLAGAKSLNHRFVRTGPEVGDLHLFDALTVYVVTNDCANNNPIGKLWVEYDISLYAPVVTPSDPISRGCSMFLADTNYIPQPGLFGPISFNSEICNPFAIVNNNTGVFTPPRGMYIIRSINYVTSSSVSARVVTYQIMKNGIATTGGTGICSPDSTHSASSVIERCVSCSGTDTISISTKSDAGTDSLGLANLCMLIFTLC